MAKIFSTSGTNYWPDLGGTTLLEDSNSGADLREYIYFNGQRVARRDVQTNTVHYMFANHLGSTSLVTNANGNMSACNGTTSGQFESDYYPYGGEIPVCNSLSDQNYKFIGKERDVETGLDNFGARYDSSALGRFMTPDWAAKPTTVPYAKFGDPQTLNLYAYVENSPINQADADGHDIDFTDAKVEQTFGDIGKESQSFRSEVADAKADHGISVTVEPVGARQLSDHAPGDATASRDSDGKVHMTIRVKAGDDGTTEHELGHEKDARTNTNQFFKDALKDKKDKGGPAEKQHDDRPVEKRADDFKKTVEKERKEYRQEQKRQRSPKVHCGSGGDASSGNCPN